MAKRASSATSVAQSTATELGRDRHMRRNVPMVALFPPQPTTREKKRQPPENTKPEKKQTIHRIDMTMYTTQQVVYHTPTVYHPGDVFFKITKQPPG